MLNVLIACEESQRTCLAFRKLGHHAFSCDIQECSGGYPSFHINGDVLPLLNGNCLFKTQDGLYHYIEKWDIIIAHPPCTYLSCAGACNLYRNGILDNKRVALGYEAADFFNVFLNTTCQHVCIENPRPIGMFGLPKHTQHIEPYYFGDPFAKRTYLWLIGLPPLHPTNVLSDYVKCTDSEWYNTYKGGLAKNRSKTFPGIANAFATQFSQFVENKYPYDYQLEIQF